MRRDESALARTQQRLVAGKLARQLGARAIARAAGAPVCSAGRSRTTGGCRSTCSGRTCAAGGAPQCAPNRAGFAPIRAYFAPIRAGRPAGGVRMACRCRFRQAPRGCEPDAAAALSDARSLAGSGCGQFSSLPPSPSVGRGTRRRQLMTPHRLRRRERCRPGARQPSPRLSLAAAAPGKASDEPALPERAVGGEGLGGGRGGEGHLTVHFPKGRTPSS